MLYAVFDNADCMTGVVDQPGDDRLEMPAALYAPGIIGLSRLEVQRRVAVHAVRNAADAQAKQVRSDCAGFEPDTWDVQQREWLRWSDNTDALTPYVDRLATGRGIERTDLMAKIEIKMLAIAGLQADLHKAEDQLKAAADAEALDAVVAGFVESPPES